MSTSIALLAKGYVEIVCVDPKCFRRFVGAFVNEGPVWRPTLGSLKFMTDGFGGSRF